MKIKVSEVVLCVTWSPVEGGLRPSAQRETEDGKVEKLLQQPQEGDSTSGQLVTMEKTTAVSPGICLEGHASGICWWIKCGHERERETAGNRG